MRHYICGKGILGRAGEATRALPASEHPLGRAGEGLELVLGGRADVAAATIVSGVFSAGAACDGLGSRDDAAAEHCDRFPGRAGGDVVRFVAQAAAQDGERG
jgi:hypothetical protein